MSRNNLFKIVAMAAERKSTIPALAHVTVSNGIARATDCDILVAAPVDMSDGVYDLKGNLTTYDVNACLGDIIDVESRNDTPADGVGFGDLPALLRQVMPAVSTEATRYYLNGMFFDCEEKPLRIVATDGHRMAALQTAFTPLLPSVIVPRQALAIICAFKGGQWSGVWSDKYAVFTERDTGLVVQTKLIDGAYPDYARIIPRANTFNTVLIGDAKTCKKIVDGFKTYGSQRSKPVSIQGGQLTARCEGLADKVERWPVDIDGAPVTIGFNAKYLSDALGALGSDTFALRISDAASPVRIDSLDNDNLVQVVMPLRV